MTNFGGNVVPIKREDREALRKSEKEILEESEADISYMGANAMQSVTGLKTYQESEDPELRELASQMLGRVFKQILEDKPPQRA